jgi:hypothetical protein
MGVIQDMENYFRVSLGGKVVILCSKPFECLALFS